jgi:hypothetical protein
VFVGLKYKSNFYKEILLLLLFFWIGFIFYTIAVENGILYAVGKIQWPKMSVWISALCVIFSTTYFLKRYTKPRFLPLFSVIPVLFLSVFVLFFSKINPITILRKDRMAGIYEETTLSRVHYRIRKEVPVNALFLVPPSDDSFGCESERSALTGFRAVIHEPWFMVHWYETFSAVYHVPLKDGLHTNILPIASDNFRRIPPPSEYIQKATHILTEPGVDWPLGYADRLFTEEGYSVWRVSSIEPE